MDICSPVVVVNCLVLSASNVLYSWLVLCWKNMCHVWMTFSYRFEHASLTVTLSGELNAYYYSDMISLCAKNSNI